MKNYSNLATTFLRIILWISLISTTIALIVIVLDLIAVTFDFNLPIFSGIKITIGATAVTIQEIKKAGIISFVVFGISAVCYLLLLIKLTNNALNVLYKVDFQNPFNEYTSNSISKLGSTALTLGILNIVFSPLISLFYHNRFVIDFSFENLNFLIMGTILYIVSLIFKRGVALQSENDLTI